MIEFARDRLKRESKGGALLDRMPLRKVVSLLLFAAMLAFGAFYYTRHKNTFQLMTPVSAGAVVALVILKVASILCYAWQVKVVTDHYALNLRFPQWFGLSRVTNFVNLLLPFGSGSSFKAVYLKKFHNLPYSSFVASGAITVVVRLAIMGLFTVVLLLPMWRVGIVLLGIALAAFIGAMVFLLFGYEIQKRYFPSWSTLANLANEWRAVRADHSMIKKIILLNCLLFATSSLEVYASFKAFSINASLASSGIISASTIFLGAAQLVPANLGIKEGVFMAVSSMFENGVNEGLHAAALNRLVGTVCTLLIAPAFTFSLAKKTLNE